MLVFGVDEAMMGMTGRKLWEWYGGLGGLLTAKWRVLTDALSGQRFEGMIHGLDECA